MSLTQRTNAPTPIPFTAPDTMPIMDEETEMALLGGLLLGSDENNTAFRRVMHLTDAAFALPRNKRIWEAMQSVFVRNIEINIDSVRSTIGSITETGSKHFDDLMRMAGENFGTYSKILEEIET